MQRIYIYLSKKTDEIILLTHINHVHGLLTVERDNYYVRIEKYGFLRDWTYIGEL